MREMLRKASTRVLHASMMNLRKPGKWVAPELPASQTVVVQRCRQEASKSRPIGSTCWKPWAWRSTSPGVTC